MMQDVNVPVWQKLLPALIKFVGRAGLLHLFITFSDKWCLRRNIGRLFSTPVLKRRTYSSFQILCYHRVNDENDPFFTGVPVALFAAQMEILSRYFNVLPLSEILERAKVGDIPPKTVALTFDDGYRDNYTHAFPILKRFRLPATIFLATGPIDAGIPLWHDRLFEIFRRTKKRTLLFKETMHSLYEMPQRSAALHHVARYLCTCMPKEREDLLQQIGNDLEVSTHARSNEMLRWHEVREMRAGRISFGAHTVTHPILSYMPIPEAVQEITASKQRIEEQVNDIVSLFAYPNGRESDFNDHIKRAVQTAGFLGAVTTLDGVNNKDSDFFTLRRTGMWGHDPKVSACRLGWQRFLS